MIIDFFYLGIWICEEIGLILASQCQLFRLSCFPQHKDKGNY